MSRQLNNRPSFLKDIVYIVSLVILIGGVVEYFKKYDYDAYKWADEYDRENHLGKYSDNPSVEENSDYSTEYEQSYETTTEDVESEVTTSNNVVYIHGLGDYNESDLISAKNAVESFYGLPCVIGSPASVKSEYYQGSYIVSYRLACFNAVSSNRHVYVTNEPMGDSPEDMSLTSGVAQKNSMSCFISTYQMRQNGRDIPSSVAHTVKHEMGHNFGLDHCDNQNCLMKSHGLDTHEFCDNCKRKINN